eukprot:g7500.t1
MQSAMWNFYSPISSVIVYMHDGRHDENPWTVDTVEWFENVAGISFILSVAFWAAILDTKGARFTVCLSSILLLCCGISRMIFFNTSKNSTEEKIIVLSMIFNGLAGAPIGLAPPIISNNWFPAHERTLATAISTSANYLGQAVGFIWGPLALPLKTNITSTNSSKVYIKESREKLYILYQTQCLICLVICLCVLIYFPTAAPSVPSESAKKIKTEFSTGLVKLFKHGPFLRIAVAFGVPLGWFSGWTASIRICLAHLGIGQTESAFIGTSSIFAGCLVAVLVSQLSEYITGKFSIIIMSMYAGATFFFLWFALMYQNWLPISTISVYACCICGSALMNGTIPLFYELAIETVFPVAEGSTCGFLILLQNLLQSIFLFVPVNRFGVSWMVWSLWMLIFLFTIPLAIGFNEEHRRRKVDNWNHN